MCGAEIWALPEGVQRVARWLYEAGHPHAPQMLEGAAGTPQAAAEQLGVALGQLAQSVIFSHPGSGGHVLVVAAGDRQVDAQQVAARIGPIGPANAAFVKARTGFALGGVSPVAHRHPPITLVDSSLARFDAVWAAAGHPQAVFTTTWAQLQAFTQAQVLDLSLAPALGATVSPQ